MPCFLQEMKEVVLSLALFSACLEGVLSARVAYFVAVCGTDAENSEMVFGKREVEKKHRNALKSMEENVVAQGLTRNHTDHFPRDIFSLLHCIPQQQWQQNDFSRNYGTCRRANPPISPSSPSPTTSSSGVLSSTAPKARLMKAAYFRSQFTSPATTPSACPGSRSWCRSTTRGSTTTAATASTASTASTTSVGVPP